MNLSSTDPLENAFENPRLDATQEALNSADGGEEEGGRALMDRSQALELFKKAHKASEEYQQTEHRKNWSQNYRAFSNQHVANTKYRTARYKHRSKLFRPKTRAAVRKNDATAASSLFSSEEVVSIKPQRASDRKQEVAARLLHEVLNYRLGKDHPMVGPQWFMTAVGARQDSQLTGYCVSKQYWRFEERETDVITEYHLIDPDTGEIVLDVNGEPVIDIDTETQTEVIEDRLMCDLIPGEQVFFDPTADWRNPVQGGGSFIVAFPTRKEDVRHMYEQNSRRPKMGGVQWVDDISIENALNAAQNDTNENETGGVRRAREGGNDRYNNRRSDQEGSAVWLYECFYRKDGIDWVWWMLGKTTVLSEPVPVEEAYPEQRGLRPYVMGFGSLETHKPAPMAPVTSWQPLQQESNDVTNLHLDSMKMSISPITKVRRGRNVDTLQLQTRGPDAVLMVEDGDDVTFDRAPSPGNMAQQTLNNINVDFDELAGVFSQGSVQTNRQMNETVGGMQILQGTSNSVTEFDLKVWLETWAEPVLDQMISVIRFYETSETVLAVAGERAGLLSNVAPNTDDVENQGREDLEEGRTPIPFSEAVAVMEDTDVIVRVSAGIGALDSQQKLQKFQLGIKGTMEIAPLLEKQKIRPDGLEIVQEMWALLGHKDAIRFFKHIPEDEQKPQPPEAVQLEMVKQKGRQGEQQAEAKFEGTIKSQELQLKREIEDKRLKQERELKLLELGLKQMPEGDVVSQEDQRNSAFLAAIEQLSVLMQGIAQQQNAPKRVVRDENGDIIGVDTVQ